MTIEFWQRNPGGDKPLSSAEMDAVPREGDQVTLDGESSRTVHSVLWNVKRHVAIIVLR